MKSGLLVLPDRYPSKTNPNFTLPTAHGSSAGGAGTVVAAGAGAGAGAWAHIVAPQKMTDAIVLMDEFNFSLPVVADHLRFVEICVSRHLRT